MDDFRLVLADSRPVRGTRLAELIRAMPGVSVVGTCPTLMEAYTLVEAEVPDLVLTCSAMRCQPGAAMYTEMMRLLGVHALPLEDSQDDDSVRGAIAAARQQARHAPVATRGTGTTAMPLQQHRSAAPVVDSDAVILIGASTGGVEALHRLLANVPAGSPPILIVQHIRGAFSGAFAERLNRSVAPIVTEAQDGEPLARGHVYIAPGAERHLHLALPPRARDAPSCRLVAAPPACGHRPSVDELFRSAVPLGPRAVGVILTGMGQDGAQGLLALRRAGAHTIAQDQDTSTVYGMPRVAAELGAAAEILPLQRVAEAALRAAARRSGNKRTLT